MSDPDKLTVFVEAVRASGLLEPEECNALSRAAERPGADAEGLARDLIERALLTAYQARKLYRGQGADLFLNQYILLDKLGEGGMGEVFKAKHTRLDRDVALKIIRRERLANPDTVRRFRREIRAAAALAHENVVLAYDADQSGDVHFFAMEYVDGTTLDRYVREKGPLPIVEACDYIRQVAFGLQHAHERGLIHRDIKPSNLLLSTTGVVKVSDLGLVLVDDPDAESASRITKDGLTVGTPDYVAPEQARNPRGADIRADIYSLGGTFYFLLTGAVPYPGGTPTEKMLKHAREPFPTATRADLPSAVAAVLQKMTAKKPDDRYPTPGDVAAALNSFIPLKPVPVPPPPPAYISGVGVLADEPASTSREPATDSRFRLPETTADSVPRVRKTGCLPAVLLIGLLLAVTLR